MENFDERTAFGDLINLAQENLTEIQTRFERAEAERAQLIEELAQARAECENLRRQVNELREKIAGAQKFLAG